VLKATKTGFNNRSTDGGLVAA